MAWKSEWKYVNFQIPPELDTVLREIHDRTGISRPDMLRESVMAQLGITDLRELDAPAVAAAWCAKRLKPVVPA
jgi:hypothetical protein